MKEGIFITANNIVSPLGFDSTTNIKNISDGISGIRLINDTDISSNSFYASLINTQLLEEKFSALQIGQQCTRLEKMFLLSLADLTKQPSVEIGPKTLVIITTTKGNINELKSGLNNEKIFLSSIANTVRRYLKLDTKPLVISNACISGSLGIIIAKRLINEGYYQNAVVLGGDVISKFVVSGFNAFQAISAQPTKPFSSNRSGINLGEAAASVFITPEKKKLPNNAVRVSGTATSNDACHISGPSRNGDGLYQSIIAALKEARVTPSQLGYISAHGTATIYNDEMEAIAFNRAGLSKIPVNSLKGYFGHTLGACGLLETIIGIHSMYRNELYPSLGFDTLGVSQAINVITKKKQEPLTIFLKTASGFGGCNAATVLKKVIG